MSFPPGEAHRFGWRHETITAGDLPLTIGASHMRLSHGRTPFAA